MKNQYNNLSYEEQMVVEEHARLSPHLVYEVIRKNGIEELTRPRRALIFSGIVAGLVITFSFVCKAFFMAYLPEAKWTPLVANFGYCVGFLLVILGHLQLFTENTITTVVPMFNPLTWRKVVAVARLWAIVLLSNLVGTTLAALFWRIPEVLNPEVRVAMDEIARHVAHFSVSENILRGIPAGILVASLVWMLPTTTLAFWLITFFTYLIALGDFTHIVVGSSEMAYWIMAGEASLGDYFLRFLLPTGLGNIIGGTGIFTLLIYVQVMEDIKNKRS